MSELIEFLRHEANVADSDGVPDTARRYREAVDGIGRLVEVIDEQRQQNENTQQEIERLTAENEALRKDRERQLMWREAVEGGE